MAEEFWWIWIILAALFVVGEIFTSGFFLLWFGVGAGVAGLLAKLGVGTAWQWGAFAITSLVLFMVSRPFANRISKEQPPGIGADRFVGKDGVVIVDIDDLKNTGRVRVDSEEWRAEAFDKNAIATGTQITVTAISGNHFIVKSKEDE